jgi:superfamily II DNA or RNA helicase
MQSAPILPTINPPAQPRKIETINYLDAISIDTTNFLKPILFNPNDRISIDVDDTVENFIVQAYSVNPQFPDDESKFGYASYAASEEFLKRIPERKRLHGTFGKWLVAGTDFSAIVINGLWPREKIRFTEPAQMLFDFLLSRFVGQAHKAKAKAAFAKDKATLPYFAYIDTENPETRLSRIQQLALYCAMGEEAQAEYMEQGTGKTAPVIARICNEANDTSRQMPLFALIVCPKNVCTNWKEELLRFGTGSGRVAVMRGTQTDRIKILIDAFSLHKPESDLCHLNPKWVAVICSYQTMVKSFDAIAMIKWDLAVADESHYFKSMKTARAKKMLMLRDFCRARMGLTGTPINNSILDLYSQLEWLGKGLSGFTSLKAFKEFYTTTEPVGYGIEKIIAYQNLPLLKERLARLSIIARKSDCLQLPPKVYDIYDVEMTWTQAAIYRKVQTQLAVEIQDDIERAELSDQPNAKQMVINSVLTKLLRLSQITAGFVTYSPQLADDGESLLPSEIERLDPNPKIEALVEILKEKLPNEKTIIWSNWVQSIKTIRARLELEGIDAVTYYGQTKDEDREIAVKRFNCDPNCRVFIGNPGAGSAGINLHGFDYLNPDAVDTNCTHVIYFSQDWSMPKRAQSEDRCHRRGTRVSIRYTDLCVPNTIDEEIRKRVLGKMMNALELQDLRSIMQILLSQKVTGEYTKNGDNDDAND